MSQKSISILTGIKSAESVKQGVNHLVEKGLVMKWLARRERSRWRHYVYKLKNKAVHEKGKSYLIVNKRMLNKLRELTLTERKIYVSLAMRASINEAEELDNKAGYRAFGKLRIGDIMGLAGVCRKTVYNAINGLESKNWIELFDDGFMGEMSYAINIVKME